MKFDKFFFRLRFAYPLDETYQDNYDKSVGVGITLTMIIGFGVRRSVGRLEGAFAHARHQPRAAASARHPHCLELRGIILMTMINAF